MKATKTPFEGLLLFESPVYKDSRGHFLEMFRVDRFLEAGVGSTMVQENQSFSKANVVRGLHFQNPTPQGKFVSASYGEVFDVAVDIRPDSPTFKQWFGVKLTGENGLHLWIPAGFAHGFATLTEAVLSYQVSDYYDPKGDSSIRWDDPEIGVEWPVSDPILSEKDLNAPLLSQLPQSKLVWS